MNTLNHRTTIARGAVLAFCLAATLGVTACASKKAKPNPSSARSAAPPSTSALSLSHYAVKVGGERIEVNERELNQAGGDLPPSIHMRQALSVAKSREWQALMSTADKPWDPNVSVETIRGMVIRLEASDGVEFLVDNDAMALWYRKRSEPWACAVMGLNIPRRSGAPAHLPACYAGLGRFLIAEALPGGTHQCATFLIDTERAQVLARSDAVPYGQNPVLTIPTDWKSRFGFEIEPAAAGNASPSR